MRLRGFAAATLYTSNVAAVTIVDRMTSLSPRVLETNCGLKDLKHLSLLLP